jgi:glycosyltransferase involved in cell wall biosynthesis
MKNEEHNIPRLLKSVEGCFDEIILTDTGSTDASIEVAKKHGAKVKTFEWIDDFAAARNFSFEGIKTDFVCWLDLDDVLENPQGFLNFRNDAMTLGDYWIASYHYSSDPSGKALCTFARERVFRVSKGYQWKYFVHEGMMPTDGTRMHFTPVWSVRHMRSEDDLKKDRMRNLALFTKPGRVLDNRMTYYYGKELFECGKPAEAIPQLAKALEDIQLQAHDRILAMQYLCYCYLQTNQLEHAIQIATQATVLAPHRAEFYNMIADCLIKQGRLADAIPALNAAKSCQIQASPHQASAVFHSEEAYTTNPRINLAKIYANMGDMDRAENEAQESASRWNHDESKQVLTEIRRIKGLSNGYKNATPCDDITIVCPPQSPYLWDKDQVAKRSIGGSEIAAIEMAEWLHKKSGRPVKVFNMREDSKVCDGVEYIPCAQVNEYMAKHKPWLNINWRHNIKTTDAPTFVWSHDLATPGVEVVDHYTRVLCLTPFHKRYMMATQGVPEGKIHVTRNGINPKRFKPIDYAKKDPNKFVFSSSPDRGLDRAMRVLDKVRLKHPGIKLHIFYGRNHLDAYGLKDMRLMLDKMVEERKDWVIDHGATPQDQLIEEFETAAYCVQPSDWIETSKITAIEHLCSGVYQVTRAIGGCVDTMAYWSEKGMGTLVESECITEAEHDVYVQATLKAIEEEAYKRIQIAPQDIQNLSWKRIAEEWLQDLPLIAYGEPADARTRTA